MNLMQPQILWMLNLKIKFQYHKRHTLLKIPDFGKSKMLKIYFGQCVDPHKSVSYDYKDYIMCMYGI